MGDDVTFFIGSVMVGTVAAQSQIITPYTLFPSNIDAAINLARLLQSLDGDDDNANGVIVIDSELEAQLPSDTNFANDSFEADLNIVLVSPEEAVSQLNDNIVTAGGDIPDGGHIPVADAGANQNITTASTVTLDGSGSSDADGDALTFHWSFISMPDGSAATLSDVAVVNPTFTADRDGSYILQLIVNDGTLNSAADTVTITASTTNAAPTADADSDQSVNTGSVVTLDGASSADADGDTITYSWSFTSVPNGSGAALSDTAVVNPAFTVDRDGSYVLRLIVNDGILNSAADTVRITAVAGTAHTWSFISSVAEGTQFDAQVGPDDRIHLISSRYYQLNLDGSIFVNENQGDDQQDLLDFPPAIAVGDDGSVHPLPTRESEREGR